MIFFHFQWPKNFVFKFIYQPKRVNIPNKKREESGSINNHDQSIKVHKFEDQKK